MRPCSPEHLGQPAQDLGEDDAGVAARAHERGARELLRERLAAGGGRGLERLHDRAHGQGQVRPGVAVGHRVDVEVVDPLPVRLEIAERGAGRSPWRARASRGLPYVLDSHLDGGDREAGLPLDLVGDARAHRRRDLGEVEPVLDHDVEVDLDARRRAP